MTWGRVAATGLERTKNIANLCHCSLSGVVMIRGGKQLCSALCIFRSFISSENGQRECLLGKYDAPFKKHYQITALERENVS